MRNNEFIPISNSELSGNELVYLENCIKTNWISSLGEYVTSFENLFSKLIKVEYSLSCSNGTVALHLALLGLEIKPGDEVIVPSFTFIATINAILYCGAIPVFVDIDPVTWCLDPNDVKQKITSKTKAIMVVHLYGNPAAMNELGQIAKRNNLFIVEDCAESLGASYEGLPTGGFGDISCFSFYGNKLITSGEGGMVSTKNPVFFERMKTLRDHGMSPTRRYYHEAVGYNYRFTNIQAAVALAQLEKIDEFLKRRKEIFTLYSSLLDIPQIQLPFQGDDVSVPVNWLYTIIVKDGKRDEVISVLKENNIDSRPTFHPCHRMPFIDSKTELPVTEIISTGGISLPTYTQLKDADIVLITDIIKSKLSI